jgi:hypothetical protein
LFGCLVLGFGLWRNNQSLRRAGLVTFVVAGLFAGGVFLSGEPAANAVEQVAGITEQPIDRHEDAATVATVGAAVLAVLAALLLWYERRSRRPALLGTLLLTFGLLETGAMAWTANLGGQIHHPEVRAANGTGPAQPPAERGEGPEGN